MLSRRHFIRSTAITTLGFMGLRALSSQTFLEGVTTGLAGYGPLIEDPHGLIRLPKGFSYTTFSHMGEEMADGFLVPGMHDGMAAFAGSSGETLLVRNHELESRFVEKGPYGPKLERFGEMPEEKIYDAGKGIAPNIGGTTTVVFNTRTQKMKRHFLSLAGTVRNCAGGPTPWGTWVTCEEVNHEPEPNAEKAHGYNFEVQPSVEPGLVTPVPLKAMGRFRHEAIAIDDNSGAVYQTEDSGDGLLYRFLPHEKQTLAAGGRLQALALVDERITDTRNWTAEQFPVGKPLAVRWIDLDNPESPLNDLRTRGVAAGAVPFARGEGAWAGKDGIYFAMTSGGKKLKGQIFRYVPSPFEGTEREREEPGRLELYLEPNDSNILNNGDNIAIAPWGDLLICEDNDQLCRLLGVTPQGEVYAIAQNVIPKRELAGCCFSPDGTTLFFNVQTPGYTVAITGPWSQRAQA